MSEAPVPQRVLQQCLSIDEPTYVYNLARLRSTASAIQEAFRNQGTRILFATMANPRREVLETLAGLGVGACVNSVAHLRAAIQAGIPPDRIQFTSSGLSLPDLREVAARRVQCNVDSSGQAEMLMDNWPGGTLGVRINKRLLMH